MHQSNSQIWTKRKYSARLQKEKECAIHGSRKNWRKELDRLEKAGILSKVISSEWVAPTVYVRKKFNQFSICADFSTDLNAVLKDYHYPLSTPEEVFNKLNDGVVFSKVDLSDAYLQIPVEEECSKLQCINTHRGLYKFERLDFVVKVASAIFQQVIDTMLGGLDFACAYLDDIVIASKSTEEHRRQIHAVFERIDNFRFRIKETKCGFLMNEISYLGHIIDKNGRHPDPERAKAIKDMPSPRNVTELQSFLGLANFYQVFIKNMHELKKDKKWEWTTECQAAFEKIKPL